MSSKIIKIYEASREELIYLIRNATIKFVNMTSDPEDQESMQRSFVTLTYAIKVSTNSIFGAAETAIRESFDGLFEETAIESIVTYSKESVNDFECNILQRTAAIDKRLSDTMLELMAPLAYINGGIDHIVENRLADILGNEIKNKDNLEFLQIDEEESK